MEDKNELRYNELVNDIKSIIETSKNNAVRSVDFCRVQMYWGIGKRIFEDEQKGEDRAEYGSYLLTRLAKEFEPEYGSGFSKRQLERARQFYKLYPNASALRTQLNWSQYKMLISISDQSKREYYELEAANNAWNGRELERQINSKLYERLLLSNDKEQVLSVARRERIPQKPEEVVKDPMYLEFLGLERKAAYYEKDLECAIMDHITEFLLEMGNGFLFSARQKRIIIEDDEFFIDLVFYNRLLRCFTENPTIGILLCSDKNDTAVRMSLPEDNKTILASKYELYLPSKEQLLEQINEAKEQAQHSKEEDMR